MSHDFEGSKGHTGVTEVKSVIFLKKFQLQQKSSICDVIRAYELSSASAQKLFVELNSKVHKGHFRVKFKNMVKIIKNRYLPSARA